MNPSYSSFQKLISSRVTFNAFLFTKLPAAFFAGLKPVEVSQTSASILVKEKWFNKNPFNSIYFAILAMAAELSTGILSMGAVYKRNPAVSMLVVKQEGVFYKKAKGKIIFTSADGLKILQAVEESITTGEGRSVTCHSKGVDENDVLVAEFYFTWSFKAKAK